MLMGHCKARPSHQDISDKEKTLQMKDLRDQKESKNLTSIN